MLILLFVATSFGNRGTPISSADITDEVQLGVPGEAFNFSQCENKVTVAEGAGLTGNVSEVEQFICEYAKA